MVDGSTLRFGVVDDPAMCAGKQALKFSMQWKNNDLYRFNGSSSKSYTNNLTGIPNDQLYFDGTRNQIAYLENSQRIAEGDTVWQTFSVKMDDWVFADDNKVLNQFHSPDNLGVGLSPYLAWYMEDGKLTISGWTHNGNRPENSRRTNVFNQVVPAASTSGNHDKWQDWIVNFKRDPFSNSAFVNIWHRVEGGSWNKVVDYNGPFGFNYSGYDGGDYDYLVNSYYQWHAWGNETDTSYPKRDMWWAWNSMLIDNNNKYDIDDFKQHVDANVQYCE